MCDLDCFHFSPIRTSHRSITTTTSQPRLVTTHLPTTSLRSMKTTTAHPPVITTKRAALTRTQTTRSSLRSTTQSVMLTTLSTAQPNKTSRSPTKPTVHTFWAEWSPTNDVEVFTASDSKNSATKPMQISNSSKIVMDPFLQEILNAAIASNHMSTTTQRSVDSSIIIGDGFNSIKNNGER